MGIFSNCRAKSQDECPAEFKDAMRRIKRVQFSVIETIKYLEMMLAIGGDDNIPQGSDAPAVTILQQLSQVFRNYSNYFLGSGYSERLLTLSEITSNVSQLMLSTHEEILHSNILPIKLWATEDYPRLKREMDNCFKLGLVLKKAEKALKSRRNDNLRKSAAERARTAYENQYNFCKNELDNIEKAYILHKRCLELMLSLLLRFANNSTLQWSPEFARSKSKRSVPKTLPIPPSAKRSTFKQGKKSMMSTTGTSQGKKSKMSKSDVLRNKCKSIITSRPKSIIV